MSDLDQQDLLDRLDGDAELARELLAVFREEAPGMLEQLRRAARVADAEALARAAHNLKGSAANVSAVAVRALAERVEELGLSGSMPLACTAVEQLEAAVARLDEAIDHWS